MLSVPEKTDWSNWLDAPLRLCQFDGRDAVCDGSEECSVVPLSSLPASLVEAIIKDKRCPGDLRRAVALAYLNRTVCLVR